MQVEVCVVDLDGMEMALTAGADRAELCSSLESGGITPGIGFVEEAVRLARSHGRPDFVHVLVRPRAGGYVYSDRELRVMERDISAVAGAGASGVVIGALTPERALDRAALARLSAQAADLDITVHRAVDAAADPLAAVVAAADVGASRVLTSGGAQTVAQGIPVLKRMVASAPPGLEIMAGGGFQGSDIPALRTTGVDAVHFSARIRVEDPNPAGPGGGTGHLFQTDASLLAENIRWLHS